jgi:hypothetical protein
MFQVRRCMGLGGIVSNDLRQTEDGRVREKWRYGPLPDTRPFPGRYSGVAIVVDCLPVMPIQNG